MSAFVSSTFVTCATTALVSSNRSTCDVNALASSSFVRPVLPTRRVHQHRQTRPSPSRCTTTSLLTIDRLANKSFQLEEDEDSASCTSAIYLNADGTVSMGRTDGPRPDRVDATWTFDDKHKDGELILNIERTFRGENGSEFSVKRVLRGHVDDSRKNLENLPVFTGAMFPDPTDFSKNCEVGWFAMILATDDLPSADYDISNNQ